MRENFLGIPMPVCNERMVREDYKKLTELLIEKKLTITTMESATSGQIASLITDTEGASAVFKGAYITYSNEAKIMCGVPEKIIEEFSVYSQDTAIAMASACRNNYGADIGVGVTGTFENIDPENMEASVIGEVYFAIDYRGEIISFKRKMFPQPNRLLYKLLVAKMVYDELDNILAK